MSDREMSFARWVQTVHRVLRTLAVDRLLAPRGVIETRVVVVITEPKVVDAILRGRRGLTGVALDPQAGRHRPGLQIIHLHAIVDPVARGRSVGATRESDLWIGRWAYVRSGSLVVPPVLSRVHSWD